ncbi:MAG TPA: (2Fe-2S)-binding protein [Anaeromyxobacteraceae bacterium]|nr:(2Fe-2S)-binding protein [Anaeromyxobacteraceae bacterium]
MGRRPSGEASSGAPPAAPGQGAGDGTWRQTRREFLATSAAATAAAAIPEAAGAAKEAAPGLRGPGPVRIALRVNGARRTAEVLPGDSLADVLRDDLGLTGTKIGCDRGACSACTVWLDGAPHSACLVFALDVGEREVTTVEGLARGKGLHPVQAAFVAHDAAQCGYCTPGMVMSAAALLARNASPSLDEVKGAVSGNLCRCGTYAKVFEAVLAAARGGAGR